MRASSRPASAMARPPPRADDLNAYLWRADEDGAGSSCTPLAVKDIFCTEGVPTTAGSRILAGYEPPYTATAARNVAEAGVGLLGKTNMDEFAMGSSNENSGYGPVLNPWDRERVPAAPRGLGGGGRRWARAVGDRHGHRRLDPPAGVAVRIVMKPTYGAVSRYGMIAFASSLDQCGPLTRDVTDAALLLSLPSAAILRLHLSRDRRRRRAAAARGAEGLRFAVPSELATDGVESGVRSCFEATLTRIEELGGEVGETALPSAEHGISAYYVIAPAEASANLARYDGVRFGIRGTRRSSTRCTRRLAPRDSATR